MALLLVYAGDETNDCQIALGSKECRRAETERRSDVEAVSQTLDVCQGVEKEMMGRCQH
jgi:hypothetical protein